MDGEGANLGERDRHKNCISTLANAAKLMLETQGVQARFENKYTTEKQNTEF